MFLWKKIGDRGSEDAQGSLNTCTARQNTTAETLATVQGRTVLLCHCLTHARVVLPPRLLAGTGALTGTYMSCPTTAVAARTSRNFQLSGWVVDGSCCSAIRRNADSNTLSASTAGFLLESSTSRINIQSRINLKTQCILTIAPSQEEMKRNLFHDNGRNTVHDND